MFHDGRPEVSIHHRLKLVYGVITNMLDAVILGVQISIAEKLEARVASVRSTGRRYPAGVITPYQSHVAVINESPPFLKPAYPDGRPCLLTLQGISTD